MATLVNLSYDISDLIGADFDPRRTKVYVTTNIVGDILVVDGTSMRLGDTTQTPATDGTGTFTGLVATNSADNPTSFAYRLTVDYARRSGPRGRGVWTSSEFPLTASANIAAIPEAFDGLAIPVEWRSVFRAELEAIRDDQIQISGIDSTDSAVAALFDTAAGPLTQAAAGAKDVAARNVRMRYLDDQPGVALDGITECGVAIQTAINAAETDGVHLVAGRRVYETATTLTFKKSADFYESTISYSGATGTAVVIGDDVNGITRQDIRIGRVVNTAMGTGWGAVVGSIGVKIVDTSKSVIRLKSIVQFEAGVQILGHLRGCAYNTIHVGELQTNKVNMEFLADTLAGFTNANHIVGGSWNHDGTKSGGTGIVGTRHVLMDNVGPGPVADTNTFTACHFEGNTVEYMVSSYGKMNTFRDCRWEAVTPKVLWQAGSYGNAIRDGYKPELVQVTNSGDPDNTITWPASGDTSTIVLGVAQLNVGALGTATKTHLNRHPCISTAASSALTATVQFPKNWHTYDVALHLTHDVVAGAGTTTWLYRPASAGNGDSLALPAGGTVRTITVPAQGVLLVSTLETGVTVARQSTTINLIRDSVGTFTGNVQVVAVVLTKRS